MRNSALRQASVVLGGLLLVAFSLGLQSYRAYAAPAGLEPELVVVDTGGYFGEALREHFYDPFAKATGVRVHQVRSSSRETMAKVKAMIIAGQVEYDIISPAVSDMIANREWLYDFGNCSVVPNVSTQGVPGTCLRYGILRTIGGGVIAYNTNHLSPGRHPTSWADFWDVKRFPGPRALYNAGSPVWNLMAALMADGVPTDKLFPLDFDRAYRKLEEIRPYVKVWWRSGDQIQQLMRQGEVVMSMMWSGSALSLKSAGDPIDVEWNQAIKDVAPWAMLKDAPHQRAALAFLKFFMDRPEAHLAYSRQVFYDTSNAKAVELLPQAERRSRGTDPANWGRMATVDEAWVAERRNQIVEQWNSWLAR